MRPEQIRLESIDFKNHLDTLADIKFSVYATRATRIYAVVTMEVPDSLKDLKKEIAKTWDATNIE